MVDDSAQLSHAASATARGRSRSGARARAQRDGGVPLARRRSAVQPKRPPNAYIVFRSHFIRSGGAQGVTRQQTISKLASDAWKKIKKTDAAKPFYEEAKRGLEEFWTIYPGYTWNEKKQATGTKKKQRSKRTAREQSKSPRPSASLPRAPPPLSIDQRPSTSTAHHEYGDLVASSPILSSCYTPALSPSGSSRCTVTPRPLSQTPVPGAFAQMPPTPTADTMSLPVMWEKPSEDVGFNKYRQCEDMDAFGGLSVSGSYGHQALVPTEVQALHAAGAWLSSSVAIVPPEQQPNEPVFANMTSQVGPATQPILDLQPLSIVQQPAFGAPAAPYVDHETPTEWWVEQMRIPVPSEDAQGPSACDDLFDQFMDFSGYEEQETASVDPAPAQSVWMPADPPMVYQEMEQEAYFVHRYTEANQAYWHI